MRPHLLGVGLACLMLLAADEATDEQKAAEALQKSGAAVRTDPDAPGKPAVRVDFNGDRADDAALSPLGAMTHLRELNLGGAHITDAGLKPIRRLTTLRKLYLTGTPVTDAGLDDLENLTRLEVLDLAGTKVTDAGLTHLADLPKLRVLDLNHTAVTGAGLAALKNLDNLKELYLLGDKPGGEKEGSEFEEKVLDFLKAQPQVKVVR